MGEGRSVSPQSDPASRPNAGRPTGYSQEIAERIIEAIATGQSLRFTLSAKDMPSLSTWWRWLAAHPELWDQYTRAQEMKSHLLIEDIPDIADGEEDPRLATVRINARVIYAEKCAPKVYGKTIGNFGVGILALPETAIAEIHKALQAAWGEK
jgi:hypothetical protein